MCNLNLENLIKKIIKNMKMFSAKLILYYIKII